MYKRNFSRALPEKKESKKEEKEREKMYKAKFYIW